MNEQIKILIISDVDLLTSNKITEKYICNKNIKIIYDICLICGPFIHSNILNKEDESLAIGLMSSILAQFENIVCRVIYLSNDNDPISSLFEQLNLTPNSINIYSRSLPLINSLYISGYTEKDNLLINSSYNNFNSSLSQSSNLKKSHNNNEQLEEENEEDSDDDESLPDLDMIDSDDENNNDEILKNNYELQTSTSSKIITELLTKAPEYSYPNDPSSANGIFMLNYKYLHTLNHFLFFQYDLLHSVNIKLLIIPTPSIHSQSSSSQSLNSPSYDEQQSNNSSSSSSSSSHLNNEEKKNEIILPKQFRGITIVSPASLRLTGGYSVVTLTKILNSWEVEEVKECNVNSI